MADEEAFAVVEALVAVGYISSYLAYSCETRPHWIGLLEATSDAAAEIAAYEVVQDDLRSGEVENGDLENGARRRI